MYDVNCFYGYWPNQSSCIVGRRDLRSLKALGIERFCMSSTKAIFWDWRSGNDEILAFAAKNPEVIPVAVFPHGAGKSGEVDEYLQKGVRLFRVTDLPGVRDAVSRKWLETLSENECGLIVPYGHDPFVAYSTEWHQGVLRLAEGFPRITFILSGLNYPHLDGVLELLGACGNTLLEISWFQLCDGIRYLCHSVGAERLVFGTNCPVFTPEAAVLKLEKANVGEPSKRMIAKENLASILEVSK